MIVLDAGVLIGYLDGTDAHHAAAYSLLTHAVDDDLAANALTLAEVLVAPARAGRLEPVLDALTALELQELAVPVNLSAHLARLRVDTGLRMPDCCVLLSAELTGAGVASFDRRLTRAAAQRGLDVFDGLP